MLGQIAANQGHAADLDVVRLHGMTLGDAPAERELPAADCLAFVEPAIQDPSEVRQTDRRPAPDGIASFLDDGDEGVGLGVGRVALTLAATAVRLPRRISATACRASTPEWGADPARAAADDAPAPSGARSSAFELAACASERTASGLLVGYM
jgi:hypothetical protein